MEISTINGTEDLRQIFNKTLLMKEKLLRTVLSDKPLVYLLGKEYAEKYMQERKQQGIFLRSLRASALSVDQQEHADHSNLFKEVRYAPAEIKFPESLILWDDFIVIINPKKIAGVLIQNKNNADIMNQWFDFVWLKSKSNKKEK